MGRHRAPRAGRWPGKRADFTVLSADPTEVELEAIRDIEIWGTVLDGRPHPIP